MFDVHDPKNAEILRLTYDRSMKTLSKMLENLITGVNEDWEIFEKYGIDPESCGSFFSDNTYLLMSCLMHNVANKTNKTIEEALKFLAEICAKHKDDYWIETSITLKRDS